MFYILYGEDDYSIKQNLESIKKELGDPEAVSVNSVFLDGEEIKPAELLEACHALPFLSEKRLVVVKNLLMRFQTKDNLPRRGRGADLKKREEKELEQWRDLPRLIEQMPPSTVLVMIEDELKDKNPVFNELSKVARVEHSRGMEKQELERWIRGQAKSISLKITPDAISLLLDSVGSNLWAMRNELDKLASYTAGKTADRTDVATLISASWELNIFRLVDNVLEGKKQESLDLLDNLFKKGVRPSELLGRIADQLQRIVRAKDLPVGISAEEGKSRIGIKSKSNFPYEKTIRQARAYSLERIKAVYRLLLDYDLGVKSGRYEEETGLEVLLAEIGMTSQERAPVPGFK